MPHSTASGTERRAPSQSRGKGPPRDASVDSREVASSTEKFPDFESTPSTYNVSPAQRPNGYVNGVNGASGSSNLPGDLWRPRRESSARGVQWGTSLPGPPTRGHARQKSINDTLRDIRARGGSVSQNAHEIAGALRAPVSPRLIVWPPRQKDPGHIDMKLSMLIWFRRYCVLCGTPPRP